MQLHRKQASKLLPAICLKSISQVCIISAYHLHTSHTACPFGKSWFSQISVYVAVSTESALQLLSTRSWTNCYEWFKHFKEEKMSVGEDPRPGWPSTSTNDNHVERVRAVIHGNRRLTVWEVADRVGISIGSCHQIFTEKLHMCHISAKFVLCLFTDDQKENHVEIS